MFYFLNVNSPTSEDLKNRFSSPLPSETVVQMAKENGVRWYRHVLRRDDGHVLRKALEFEVKGKRKQGQPRKTWRLQVEKESKSVGLKKEDAKNRARWRVGVGKIAGRVR